MIEAVINLVARYFPRSFFVSYFLPLLIGTFTLIFFFPFIGLKLFEVPLSQTPTLTLLQIVLPLALVYWLANILENNSSGTLELFKGRYLPRVLARLMIRAQYRQLQKQEQLLYRYEKLTHRLEQKTGRGDSNPEEIAALQDMRERLVSEVIAIGSLGLLRRDMVYPTQIGNVFQAIEYYPMDRYGINHQVIWPELFRFIPEKLEASMKDVINNLFFFLNSSLAMIALGLFALVTVLVRLSLATVVNAVPGTSALEMDLIRFLNVTDSLTFSWNVNYSYLALGVLFFWAGRILYRFSLVTAGDYANSVRTVYDLYRFEILDRLGLRRPKNFEQERRLWSRVNEFLGVGHAFDPLQLHQGEEEPVPESHGTGAADIEFERAAPRPVQPLSSSNGRAVHVDLGGITLDLGELLKDTVKLVAAKPTPRRKPRKKSPPRKAARPARKNSKTKSAR